MKTVHLLFAFIPLIISCNSDDTINGYWTINDDYYKATYRIYDTNDCKKVQIVSYNDGTTKYTSATRPNQELFKNLKKHKDVYVDAVSGATKVTSDTNTNHIRVKHSDTLEVTTFLFGKPLKELWTRTTK